MVRVETGKTPMKPVRAVRGPPTPVSASSFVDAGEQVSPLTEAGGSGGGSGMLRQAAGMIDAALSAAQGTGAMPSTAKSAVHGAANLAAVERFGDAGAVVRELCEKAAGAMRELCGVIPNSHAERRLAHWQSSVQISRSPQILPFALETNEGTGNAVGCKADLTSTTSLPAKNADVK